VRRQPEPKAKATVRIPLELYRRLGQLAAAEGRSINNLIVWILTHYVRSSKEPPHEPRR
jgi:predicted HicB family RNase H-like nuclease